MRRARPGASSAATDLEHTGACRRAPQVRFETFTPAPPGVGVAGGAPAAVPAVPAVPAPPRPAGHTFLTACVDGGPHASPRPPRLAGGPARGRVREPELAANADLLSRGTARCSGSRGQPREHALRLAPAGDAADAAQRASRCALPEAAPTQGWRQAQGRSVPQPAPPEQPPSLLELRLQLDDARRLHLLGGAAAQQPAAPPPGRRASGATPRGAGAHAAQQAASWRELSLLQPQLAPRPATATGSCLSLRTSAPAWRRRPA
ncbi:hypothetical protein HT031_004367 [Scenedesmus sp. PABB004]|nr:hypothetical protein HT031_004367 [Scenedesmus sp. PABB004]